MNLSYNFSFMRNSAVVFVDYLLVCFLLSIRNSVTFLMYVNTRPTIFVPVKIISDIIVKVLS